MGKKLRNRVVEDEYMSDGEEKQEPTPLASFPMSRTQVRTLIRKKMTKKKAEFTPSKTTSSVQFAKTVDSSMLECPICLDIMVNPIGLLCGHIFCEKCLEHSRANCGLYEECCLCRSKIDLCEGFPCPKIEQLLNQFLVENPDEVINYICRKSDAIEWMRKRKAIDLREGALVDCQDVFGYWFKGIIYKIKKYENLTLYEVVPFRHRNDPERHCQAVGKLNRLAPPSFFSKKECLKEDSPLFAQNDEDQQLSWQREGQQWQREGQQWQREGQQWEREARFSVDEVIFDGRQSEDNFFEQSRLEQPLQLLRFDMQENDFY